MNNLKIYQICHDLIDYFVTLISPKKSSLGPIFRTRGSICFLSILILFYKDNDPPTHTQYVLKTREIYRWILNALFMF